MNKLLWKPVIEIQEDGRYFLFLSPASLQLVIAPFVNASILLVGNQLSSSLTIEVMEHACFCLQIVGVDTHHQVRISLEGEEAKFTLVYSGICCKEQSFQAKVYHLKPHTSSSLVNHVINLGKEDCLIQVDAYVPKKIKGCVLQQDNKIIPLKDGRGTILPNLYIEEFDSFVQHSAYIAKFSKDALFYLRTRGLPEETAQFLLMKAFLLGNMNLEKEEEQIIMEILKLGGEENESRRF